MEYDECLFYSINNSQVYWENMLKDQPFAFPKFVKQVFFVLDSLKLGQLIVLQNNLRLFRVFGNPLVAWDDGNHAT